MLLNIFLIPIIHLFFLTLGILFPVQCLLSSLPGSQGKQRAKVGIWDFISSGAEAVKQNTPDLATPVKEVCKSSYHYSAAAVRKIDDVVRVYGLQRLGQYIYMSDEEGRAKIVNFSTKFVKNASVYAVKEAANIFVPGGRAVSQIYSQTVCEMETESKKNQNTSCNKEITGNSSKDSTGTGPLGLLDGAEILENRELQLGFKSKL